MIVQSHWSVAQRGSLLASTMENKPNVRWNQKQITFNDDAIPRRGDPNRWRCCEGMSSASMEAFSAYQKLARQVTVSINQGFFEFTEDVLPYCDEEFTEIVEGIPLRLTAIQESFAPILAAVASGAKFSWTVELEHACDITPSTVLLITTARVALAHPTGYEEAHHYRISNILQRETPTNWVFLHQHRTLIQDTASYSG